MKAFSREKGWQLNCFFGRKNGPNIAPKNRQNCYWKRAKNGPENSPSPLNCPPIPLLFREWLLILHSASGAGAAAALLAVGGVGDGELGLAVHRVRRHPRRLPRPSPRRRRRRPQDYQKGPEAIDQLLGPKYLSGVLLSY